jgi:hypothetical protein
MISTTKTVAKIMWLDTCYRFRCAFDTRKLYLDNSARRFNDAALPWFIAGAPGAQWLRRSATVVSWMLRPVWKLRGW